MTNSMIDLRRLRYFRAIAQSGSLSQAARDLNITQPALTHHMNLLEAGLGVELFERLPRGIRLSEAGLQLLEHAKIILRQVQLAENSIRQLGQGSTGRPVVRLAISPAVAASLTPAMLATPSEQLDYVLRISEVRTQDATRLLEADEIDLAVVIGGTEAQQNCIPLLWDPLVFVSAAGGQDVPATISCDDLPNFPMILPSTRRSLRPRINSTFDELGLQLNVVTEIDGIDPRKQAVMAGLGDTITSFLNVVREYESGLLTVRQIVDPTLERLIGLKARDGFPTGLTEQITGLLKKHLKAVRHGPREAQVAP